MSENILACKWLKAAMQLPYGSAQRTAAYDAHTSACPPQHDDANASCPHNQQLGSICTCEVEDNLGWILKWSRAPRTYKAGKNADGSTYPAGKRWTDEEDNYDIYQDNNSKSFAVVCCDGTLIGEVDSLPAAQALAQREYVGIQIAFHGPRGEEK